jgi:hypothetical protein
MEFESSSLFRMLVTPISMSLKYELQLHTEPPEGRNVNMAAFGFHSEQN